MCNDHEKSLNSIFTENSLKTINQVVQFLAIEIYKFQNGLSPPIINYTFFLRQNIYNLQELSTSTRNILNFGMEAISYRGSQLRSLIHDNIKLEPTLELLKKKIRECKLNLVHVKLVKPIYNIYMLHHLIKNVNINFANSLY